MIEDDLMNVLYIDLSEKEFYRERREDLFKSRLGGSGVSIRLMMEECPEDADPLDPDNPVVFAVGPLTGLFPLGSKTISMFKSPHTGDLGESHCGGRSASSIRLSGHGAIVIKGSSNIPIYLAIHGDKVYFRDASTLWGMDSSYTVGRVIRQREPGSGIRTIMRIGRAGEEGVTYSSVITETYRHFSRLGLGAVLGSKKLKAILISGNNSVPVPDPDEYKRVYEDIYGKVVSSSAMEKYHDLGTPKNTLPLNDMGALPTRNLKESEFESARDISGESFAEELLGRRIACVHCPVACIHIAALKEQYEDEPYFYKTSMISYDYEPIYSLGSMLGVSDKADFLKLMDKVEKLGLDAISTGVSLAWATEAQKRNIISENDTDGLNLDWGNYTEYVKAIDLIVDQPNEFYSALARGVDFTASKYGGKNFALAFSGNEMAGYHTGPATYIGHLIGARHSHLDNAGYSLDQKTLGEDLGPDELVNRLVKEEQWRQILSSLVICFFARAIYEPNVVLKALKTTGFDLDRDDLYEIGREIYNDKLKFKLREGFSLDNPDLPQRIFETRTPKGMIDDKYVDEALGYFREKVIGDK